MQDYAHTARHGGAYDPDLSIRLDAFGHSIEQALRDGYNEVLVVGHSSGAHLGVSVLARLQRAGIVTPKSPISFLSLGHVVPMGSFLHAATELRSDLKQLGNSDAVTWVDVTAPGDGCSFALCDPVAVSGQGDGTQNGPLVLSAAFIPLPRWMPRFHSRATRRSAARIRNLITELTRQRADQIAAATAPDHLATKIMTTPDPETGRCFEWREMVGQLAIFFLAGHETSASALAWALYLLAENQDVQTRVAEEVRTHDLDIAGLSQMPLLRGVFREALRLYPSVPMMVRETTCPEAFRDRTLPTGSQVVLSPWHLHRHERLWDDPDAFDPERYTTENGKSCLRDAFIPFSAGARVCPGAGFAMIEGPLLIAAILRKYRVTMTEHGRPVPVAHLTVRAKDEIWLNFQERD